MGRIDRRARRALLTAALLGAAGCSRRAQANYEHCLRLRVDMSKAQMIKVMGEPDETIPFVEGKSLEYLRGRTAYEWSNPSTMPGPDHVSVFDESGRIASIRCSNAEVTTMVVDESSAPVAGSASPMGKPKR